MNKWSGIFTEIQSLLCFISCWKFTNKWSFFPQNSHGSVCIGGNCISFKHASVVMISCNLWYLCIANMVINSFTMKSIYLYYKIYSMRLEHHLQWVPVPALLPISCGHSFGLHFHGTESFHGTSKILSWFLLQTEGRSSALSSPVGFSAPLCVVSSVGRVPITAA